MSQASRARSGSDQASYTGRKRRVTRRSVGIIDTLAKYIICTGGIAVTLAFVGIVAFIFFVVIPLFGGARLTALPATHLGQPVSASVESADKKPGQPLSMGMDENAASLWVIDDQGNLTTYRAAGGELLKTSSLCDHSHHFHSLRGLALQRAGFTASRRPGSRRDAMAIRYARRAAGCRERHLLRMYDRTRACGWGDDDRAYGFGAYAHHRL